jgi:hypothetical protein
MFYHRVLPPLALPDPASPSMVSGAAKANSLLESRIMARDRDEVNAAYGPDTSRRHSIVSSNSAADLTRPPSLDRDSLDRYPESPPLRRESTRLTRKRTHSEISDDSVETPGGSLPSTAVSGRPKSGTVAVNEYCLCQPDPKVPRPRNGKSLSCVMVC